MRITFQVPSMDQAGPALNARDWVRDRLQSAMPGVRFAFLTNDGQLREGLTVITDRVANTIAVELIER